MQDPGAHSITEHARREGIYLQHLTGIRAVAALAVMVLHCWATVFQRPDGIYAGYPWWTGWMRSGGYGVAVFIVVSGYSLTLAAARRDVARLPRGMRDFWVRRARRILPAYYIVLALSAVLGLTVLADPSEFVYSLSVPIEASSVVWHVLLLHDLNGDQAGINYVLWSMAVEWHIYLLMPLFLLAVRRVGAWSMMLAAVLVSSIVARWAMHHSDASLLTQFQLVGCFAIGVGACWLARRRPDPRPLLMAAAAATMLAAALEGASYRGVAPGLIYPQSVSVVLAVAVGLFLAAAPQVQGMALVRGLGSRWLVWAGERSYSFYLLHPLGLALVWNLVLDSAGLPSVVELLALIVLGGAVTLAASAVTYRQVEVRFQAS